MSTLTSVVGPWLTPHGRPGAGIVLIKRPQAAPSGAAEMALGLVPAAIGNAVFDATGVRLRRVPFTPERVKAALERA